MWERVADPEPPEPAECLTASHEPHDFQRGAILDAVPKFLQLFSDVGRGYGIADVCVDLACAGNADTQRFQIAMVHMGGNYHASAGGFVANSLWLQLLPMCDVVHLI